MLTFQLHAGLQAILGRAEDPADFDNIRRHIGVTSLGTPQPLIARTSRRCTTSSSATRRRHVTQLAASDAENRPSYLLPVLDKVLKVLNNVVGLHAGADAARGLEQGRRRVLEDARRRGRRHGHEQAAAGHGARGRAEQRRLLTI